MHIASRKIYLKKQQGKIIDFIPTGARQMGENTYFYGSRVQAMKDLSWEFWFSYLKGTSKYWFNVGSVIYGTASLTDVPPNFITIKLMFSYTPKIII